MSSKPPIPFEISVAESQEVKSVNSVPLASRNLPSPALASVKMNCVASLLSYFALAPSCRYTLPTFGKPYVPQEAKSGELLLRGLTTITPPPEPDVTR